MGMRRKRTGVLIRITLLFMAISLLMPAIYAEPQNQSWYTRGSGFIDELNNDKSPVWNASHPVEYHATPQPVTLFRAELNETHLPGPRYMAFGPSSINLVIDPLLLAVVILVVALSIITWFVTRYAWNKERKA
ncbi:hypothetical protein [uncultured Methanoregula sp.]|uniref:hypothetical protein n=1 Tax=uncultured Methanoregula sp. TaxID=1005933 RepID=UPI003749D752